MASSHALIGILIFVLTLNATHQIRAAGNEREFYQPSKWSPRAILPAADALRGDFFPPSPAVEVNYDDPSFDATRLAPPPAPGVHPRVLLTPSDAEIIRAKIALGDRAPATFRAMWTRVSKNKAALYAYIAQDQALGQKLAAEFMIRVRALGPRLDAMEKYPDHENLWSVERSMAASGDPNEATDIWQLPNYDLLYQWLSDSDRALTRQTIARVTHGRISNFLNVPDHFMINNHEGFGMAFVPVLLCIEGEEGFDPRVYELTVRKLRAMLNYYLSKDGVCYETIKGWLNVSAFVAVARRDRDLLKHSHLRAKMDYFLQALRWERPNLARPLAWIPPGNAPAAWMIRDEMRASAFHVIWMMNYFHPGVPRYDFLFQASLSSHDFLTNPDARWPNPVGIDDELLLLFAQDPMNGPDGKVIDWTSQRNIDALHLPLALHDDERGYLIARNSWRKDDLAVQFACKQQYYYGGHEGSEHGRFTFWADGVNWAVDNNSLFYKQAGLHNQITVDGLGIHWPPVGCQWLGVRDTPAGVSAAGDYKDGYSFYKSTQIHPLDFPSARVPYYAMFSNGNYTLSRNTQLAFHDVMVKFYDGYAHTDYGTWSGEHRLLDGYREWNPMHRAFRTLQLGRGEKPYLLMIDDVQKDDREHEYAWNMVLPDDVQLIKTANIPDLLGGMIPSDPLYQIDLFLGRIDTPRNEKARAFYEPLFNPKKGDPQLLVRLLRRNTSGYTLPRVEHIERFNVLNIPAKSVSPDYVVLLFPHHVGDALPKTTWSDDGKTLTIELGKQKDVYQLRKADAGRTVFAFQRDGQEVQTPDQPPAAPRFIVRGQKFDPTDSRYRRDQNAIPNYLLIDQVSVLIEKPTMSTRVHYTLDGTEPGENSPLYAGPIAIHSSCTLKARTIDPSWPCGATSSQVTTATFQELPAAAPIDSGNAKPGLLAQVFELKTVIYNDQGFWKSDRVMMPDLRQHKPIVSTIVQRLELPHAVPTADYCEQRKGFYRFSGLFHANAEGVYQFAINSCGPVTLDIAGQVVIEQTGQFHQQQAIRRGEAVLAAGWHRFELIVTDPLFWKINTDDPMPFSATYRVDGGAETTIGPDQLCVIDDGATEMTSPPPPPAVDPISEHIMMQAGVRRQEFDRSAGYRAYIPPAHDWLDIDSLTALDSRLCDAMVPNTGDSLIVTYDGYFYAPVAGVYGFDLPARTQDAIDRNQLRIAGQVIVQRGVPGRNPLRQVELRSPGYYPISIRLGKSRAGGLVTYPDGHREPLDAQGLFRPIKPLVLPEGRTTPSDRMELYSPTRVQITLPPTAAQLAIRYTTDGSIPSAQSPLYQSPIDVKETTVINAVGFDHDKPATQMTSVQLMRVDAPADGLVFHLDGADLNADKQPAGKPIFAADSSLLSATQSRRGLSLHGGSGSPPANAPVTRPVDPNLDKGTLGAGLRLAELRLPRNAVTIAMYIRLAEVNKGRIFGKWGFNSIGKAFKTVLCEVNDGQLIAQPGNLAGGKIKAGQWHHVALVADGESMSLYLDGQRVASGEGTENVVADSLDFSMNLRSDISDLRLYSRTLDAQDIAKLAGR